MPKVEQYGSQQVQTQVIQGPRAGNVAPGAFGGDLANALGTVANVVDDATTRFNTSASEDALNNFERDKNSILFNPDSGYYNSQGINAYDGAGKTNEDLGALKRKYADTLSSPESKAMFDKAAGAQLRRSNLDIQRHAAKGLKSWEVATVNASVENTIENSSLYYNSPKDLTLQNAKGRLDVHEIANMEGITGEALNERLQTYDSSFYGAAIGAATRSSSEEGQALLDKHGSRIEGPDRLKLENTIATKAKAEKIANDNREAVVVATKMISEYDGDRTKVNDKLNEIADPDLRSKTKREAHWQLDQKNKADDEERSDIYEEVDKAVIGGISPSEWMLQNGNSDKWEKLTADQQRKLTSGKNVTTNWDLYNQLNGLPLEQLAGKNPGDYVTQLATPEFTKLKNAITSARNNERDALGHNRAQMSKAVGVELFGNIGKSKSKAESYNAFMQAADDAVTQWENDTGKVADATKYKEILGGLTRTYVREDHYMGLFDQDTDIKDIKPENLNAFTGVLKAERQRVDIDNIAKLRNGVSANRDQLETELNNRSIPVNMTTLSKLYIRTVAAQQSR